jgi:hypothetical protein
MPYKNPEDKQQWERNHREQRNARRRSQHLGTQMEVIDPMSAPDPISEPNGDWNVAAAIVFALVVWIGLLAAWVGVGTSLGADPGRSSA